MRHFKLSEFDSPDAPGSGSSMDEIFLERLDICRELSGIPFRINSGYRTIEHNVTVGGASMSMHLIGRAADISTIGWDKKKLVEVMIIANSLGLLGIGLGDNFIHLDDRSDKVIWTY